FPVACHVRVRSTQVPTPEQAALIHGYDLAVRGENAVHDLDTVARQDGSTFFQQMLVIVPLEAAQVGFFYSGFGIRDMFRQQNTQLLGRAAVVAPDERGEAHIGRVEELAARLLGTSSYLLRRLCLRQAPLHLFFLRRDGCEGLFRLLLGLFR